MGSRSAATAQALLLWLLLDGTRRAGVQVVRGWVAGAGVQSLPDVPDEALLAPHVHEPLEAALSGMAPGTLRVLCDAIVLNSTATLDAAEGGGVVDNGNRTETALLRFAAGLGADAAAERARADVVAALPFSSERKRMATVVRQSAGGNAQDGRLTVYVKGAAEVRFACMAELRLSRRLCDGECRRGSGCMHV